MTPQSEKLFLQLQEHVNREVEYMKHLMEIEGMLHIYSPKLTRKQEEVPLTLARVPVLKLSFLLLLPLKLLLLFTMSGDRHRINRIQFNNTTNASV